MERDDRSPPWKARSVRALREEAGTNVGVDRPCTRKIQMRSQQDRRRGRGKIDGSMGRPPWLQNKEGKGAFYLRNSVTCVDTTDARYFIERQVERVLGSLTR